MRDHGFKRFVMWGLTFLRTPFGGFDGIVLVCGVVIIGCGIVLGSGGVFLCCHTCRFGRSGSWCICHWLRFTIEWSVQTLCVKTLSFLPSFLITSLDFPYNNSYDLFPGSGLWGFLLFSFRFGALPQGFLKHEVST